MESLRIVSFGASKIQKLRRVAIDANLLATLNLQEGDTVTVDLDVQNSTILIRKKATNGSSLGSVKRRRSHASRAK